MFDTDSRRHFLAASGAHRWGSVVRQLLHRGTVGGGSGPRMTDQLPQTGKADVMDVMAARTAATAATAAAIRQQLISPGSLPPEEQIRLILADRAAYQFRGAPSCPRAGEQR